MVYLINQLNPLVFKSLGSLFSLGLHNTLPSTCLMDIIDSEKQTEQALRPGWKILPTRMSFCSTTLFTHRLRC